MTKPMYCPLTLIDKHAPICECTPDCAWAMNNGQAYWCGMVPTDTKAALANVNTRPLKDDDE